ncbi:MAG: hypothetical protein ABEK59_07630 [Halobacteria archaeon]
MILDAERRLLEIHEVMEDIHEGLESMKGEEKTRPEIDSGDINESKDSHKEAVFGLGENIA